MPSCLTVKRVPVKDGQEVERVAGPVDFQDFERWMSVHL
jgi:hypothetical protein